MSCILSDNSSESSAVKEVAATSTSASEQAASEQGSQFTKVPQPEEKEAESEDRTPSIPHGKAPIDLPQPIYVGPDMFTDKTLHSGWFFGLSLHLFFAL